MHELVKIAIMAAMTAVAVELLTMAAARLELVGIDAEFRALTTAH